MTLRKERAAKGLCPNCGAEAAPYYLCGECHFRSQIGRCLEAAKRQGILENLGAGRKRLWRVTDPAMIDRFTYRGLGFGERGKPRLRGGIPVDVEEELLRILVSTGRPMKIKEIMAAWVKLRPRPGRSAASGVAAIMAAEDKRARRRARNAVMTGAPTA